MTRLVYSGNSMRPTFRPGDVLEVRPGAGAIHPGDVVAFHAPGQPGSRDLFVHRVVARTPSGFVTRGDHNRQRDPWLTTPDRVLGVVTHGRRGGRNRPVSGGWSGLLRASLRHTIRPLVRALRKPARVAYAALRASGLPARLWHPRLQHIHIDTPSGPLVKLLWRGRAVARWWPRQGRFACRRPLDLFIAPPRPGDRPARGASAS